MENLAFKFLLFVTSVIGLKGLPNDPDPNWIVVENWREIGTHQYRLVIQSQETADICKNGGYIVFPQNYMGKFHIYADNQLVSSNVLKKNWGLRTTLAREIISCDYFKGNKSIRLEIDSTTHYFATIERYPYLISSYPLNQFFYTDMYLVSAVFCIFFGLVGFLLFRQLKSNARATVFLIYNIAFSFLMLCHIGLMVGIDVFFAHTGVMLSLNVALIYFSLFTFNLEKIRVLHVATLLSCTALALISYGHPSTTQALIVLFIPIAIFVSFLMMLHMFRKGSWADSIIYLLIFLSIAKDVYYSQVVREGFLYLSMIILLISITGIVRVLDQLRIQTAAVKNIETKLASDRKIIQKISDMNDINREIIHDLKSPLTALEFNLHKFSNDQIFIQIVQRLKNIINRINSPEIRNNSDWYSASVLQEILSRIFSEKAIEANRHSIKANVAGKSEVFFDPTDIEIILSELIDNSNKYAKENTRYFAELREDDDSIYMDFKDESRSIGQVDGKVGIKGISSTGSGIGLISVGRKMEGIGGRLNYRKGDDGFVVSLVFRKRTAI